MSDLVTIYQAFRDMSVSVGATTPSVYTLGTAKDWAEGADLPLRLITISSPAELSAAGQFIALGTLSSITWRVSDLMLWAEAGSGSGSGDYMENVLSYAGGYVEALRGKRGPASAGSNQAHIVGQTITPGVFEYPAGSGRSYWGVECVIDVEEFLSS